ncbi:MAG: triose-phosphate isomerase, partial [Ralstonia sp.]
MNARPKLVVGNWKLHGSLNTNVALLEQIKAAGKTNATLAVCAPFPYLAQCQALLA